MKSVQDLDVSSRYIWRLDRIVLEWKIRTLGWPSRIRALFLGDPLCSARTSERTIVHVHDSTLTHASRDLRAAAVAIEEDLADYVVLLGRAAPQLSAVERVTDRVRIVRLALRTSRLPRIKVLTPLRMWEARFRFRREAVKLNPLIIQCHGVSTLGACVAAKRQLPGARLVYDPHELETESNGLKQPLKTFYKWSERRHVGRCDRVLSVCGSIAEWYQRAYGIPFPVVIRNIPPAFRRPERGSPLRITLRIPEAHRVFIYQGGLFKGRRIEQLVRIFRMMPADRHLVLLGYGALEPELREVAQVCSNIHVHAAVAPSDLLRYTQGADVGIVGVENVCLSYYLSLPNKLFEYLAAGLPVLAPPYPEITSVVKKHGCGWIVGESDDEWYHQVLHLSDEDIAAARATVRTALPPDLGERNRGRLAEVYRTLLGSTHRTAGRHGRDPRG